MMNKLMSFAACCSVLLATGGGCSKKPDPTPEETALLEHESTGTPRAGFIRKTPEEPIVTGPDITADPGDGLARRDSDVANSDLDRDRFQNKNIYFGFDQYAVPHEERIKIRKVADFLKQEPGSRLIIEGHCDWKGTPEYNQSLGDRRATSVKQYLIDLSVEPERIDTLSKGDEEATKEATPEEMRLDRKAQFVVIK